MSARRLRVDRMRKAALRSTPDTLVIPEGEGWRDPDGVQARVQAWARRWDQANPGPGDITLEAHRSNGSLGDLTIRVYRTRRMMP